MKPIRDRRPSPALIVAVVALVAAMAGTSIAALSGGEKGLVKTIAKKQINKLAPDLHVASADAATNADNATNAQSATSAQTAANADALGGNAASSFGTGVVLGAATGLSNTAQERTALGVTGPSDPATSLVGPGATKLRDFRAEFSPVSLEAGISVAVLLRVDPPVGPPVDTPLCTVSFSTPFCSVPGPISIPNRNSFILEFEGSGLEEGKDVRFAYRLTP